MDFKAILAALAELLRGFYKLLENLFGLKYPEIPTIG